MTRINRFEFPLKPSAALLFLNGQRTTLADKHLADISVFSPIVAADGAWNNLCDSTVATAVDVVLGDGDSLRHPVESHVKHVVSDDPNSTDFEKVVRYLLANHVVSADVFWGSGGEMDHFLGNLSVAARYHSRLQCRFFDDNQVYAYVNDNVVIRGAKGATISVYPFPAAVVSSRGLAYEMSDFSMQQHTRQSLRNQAISDTVTLAVKGEVVVFVTRD